LDERNSLVNQVDANVTMILLAAGCSLRMGCGQNKVLLDLAGKPVLSWSLQLFEETEQIKQVLVVGSLQDRQQLQELAVPFSKVKAIIRGGASRQESVALALSAFCADPSLKTDWIAIHDGARPLLAQYDLIAVIQKAYQYGAAILCESVTDTIKSCLADGRIEKTLPRETLFAAQTPQVFKSDLICSAYAWAKEEKITATDDASLLEKMGESVYGVLASSANLKLTVPDDLIMARALIEKRQIAE